MAFNAQDLINKYKGLLGQATSFVKQNPTPMGFLSQKVQPQIQRVQQVAPKIIPNFQQQVNTYLPKLNTSIQSGITKLYPEPPKIVKPFVPLSELGRNVAKGMLSSTAEQAIIGTPEQIQLGKLGKKVLNKTATPQERKEWIALQGTEAQRMVMGTITAPKGVKGKLKPSTGGEINIYHGTNAPIKSILEVKPGDVVKPGMGNSKFIYVSENPDIAKAYSKNLPNGQVLNGKLQGKVLDAPKGLDYLDFEVNPKLADKYIKDGYSAIRFPNPEQGVKGNQTQLLILDNSKIVSGGEKIRIKDPEVSKLLNDNSDFGVVFKKQYEGRIRQMENGELSPPISGVNKGKNVIDEPLAKKWALGNVMAMGEETRARMAKSYRSSVSGGEIGGVGEGTMGAGIQNRTMGSQAEQLASTAQRQLPVSNKPLSSETIIPRNATPQDVAATLSSRVDNFIQKTLGYSTEAPTGGTKGASLWTRTLRKGAEGISTKVEQGLGSQNTLVRNAASTLQNFFRGLGMSPERSAASMELRGGMGTANERAFNVMDTLYKSLNRNKSSLERINAVLDPDLAKIKVSLNDLTPVEKQVYGIIREGLDIVHDTSYANGHISQDLYLKNKGKYTPRLYEVMEIPAEVNKFVTQGKKMVNDMYKSRKEVTDWKVENALNDPVYALGKRLSQVETNTAIKKYTDFLASNSQFISDVERSGFTKLSDSPAYGALKGKWVLNSAAEDLKGFFFSNEAVQNLYDVFRAYDRMGIRQLQKKLLTVFNPTTNVGNIVSDQVFGFVTGVDPLTLNKNLIQLKSNPSQFKKISDYLMRQGIIGTDITRTDFVNKLGQIDELAGGKKKGLLSSAADKVQSFYGGTDDAYKASAFKALLDKGFSLEEATRKVADGFQNYANVGKFFDLASKTPIIGKPFIKFQGDLIRIIKNGAVNNPLGLISFLGILKGISILSSKLSGESNEDRITRENRFAAPMIPGLGISLAWQTPWGEINAARYMSPFYANNETTGIASNMLPFIPNIQPNKDVASNIAMNVNDPLVSPLVQLAVNRDFRGKPISDPKENKWQPSTLTPEEKIKNQAIFAGRAYTPPLVNSAIDVGAAAQGKPNMYGAKQSVPQAVARLGGIKISDMSATEVQKIRDNDLKYQGIANEAIDKQVSTVTKGVLTGEVTEDQARARIANLLKEKSTDKTANVTVGKGFVKVGETYKYLDDKGVQQTIELKTPEKPTLTGQTELDKKLTSNYNSSITSQITNITKLYELGEMDAAEAEKKIGELKKLKITAPKKGKKPSFKIKAVKFPKLKLAKVKKIKMPKAKKVKQYTLKLKKVSKTARLT